MSFRKRDNNKTAWSRYCKTQEETLTKIGLDPLLYNSELLFREYATTGTVKGANIHTVAPSQLSDETFWLLHEFITHYFEMDASLFEDYENSRVNR